MNHRKWVQIAGQLIEVDPTTYQPTMPNTDAVLWGDRHYDGMRALDGTDISSRTKHREYMKANNLAMMDDYKNTWATSEKRRTEYRSGQHGACRRQDIERAIYTLTKD